MKLDDLKTLYHWSVSEALNSPVYWYIFLIFLFLILVLWSLRKMKKDLVPVFSDDDGKVQITPHALQELVKRTCEDIPGIHLPNSSIRKVGNGLRLHVRLNVRPDCNIKETRSDLKNKLETIMVEKLSFDNFQGVDIIIKGFHESKE